MEKRRISVHVHQVAYCRAKALPKRVVGVLFTRDVIVVSQKFVKDPYRKPAQNQYPTPAQLFLSLLEKCAPT